MKTLRLSSQLPRRCIHKITVVERRIVQQWRPSTSHNTTLRRFYQSSCVVCQNVGSYRQSLKLEEKKRKEERNLKPGSKQSSGAAVTDNSWELSVGIEIHAELDTERKLFSSATTCSDASPNSNVALFDLAYPGSQPIFQVATLLPAIRAALALNCEIQPRSSFDRKHYFYPDQPAGYQITQFYGRWRN
jgi:aspartyl-tRNA(Asn)/glutamyl-tRNA(Gln) amidotransferase subunit B